MRSYLRHLTALLAILMLAFAAAPASAQQPARVNPSADAVSEQSLLEALRRDQIVHGRVSIPDKRSGNLIQPEGRAWEDWRRTTLPRLGAGLIVGMVVALLAFFAIKGRIRVEGGMSGREVVRFNPVERFAHWLTATAFIILALSGLNITFGRSLLLPVLGHEAFTTFSQWAKYFHNYMSFAFVVGLVLMFVQWVLFNIPSLRDIRWIAAGGGIFGKSHPPAGKFNAGQKLVFWVTVLGGLLMAVTGFLMMFPFYRAPGALAELSGTITGLQFVTFLHGLIAMLMVIMILGHIYIGTIGMQGAFWSMGTGKVDTNWAKQHHSVWAAKVLPKEMQGKPVPGE